MTDPPTDTTAGGALPSSNDGITIARAVCPVCGSPFHPTGRERARAKPVACRRYCSDTRRQAAWRHRHPGPKDQLPAPNGVPRLGTVYEWRSCGSRYLGEQRCPDCQLFCRRVGPGRGAASPSPAAAAVPTATRWWPSPTSLVTKGGDATQPQPAREMGHSRLSNWATPSALISTNGHNR